MDVCSRHNERFEDDAFRSLIFGRLVHCGAKSKEMRDKFLSVVFIDEDEAGRKAPAANWTAHHILEKMSFVAYSPPGDFFGPHYDMRVKSVPFLSHLSVLVYLSERGKDFEGGGLQVIDLASRGTDKVYLELDPMVGRVVLLNQEITRHVGGPVTSGMKYLIRADLMFAPSGTSTGPSGTPSSTSPSTSSTSTSSGASADVSGGRQEGGKSADGV
jgi:hypothetical protein